MLFSLSTGPVTTVCIAEKPRHDVFPEGKDLSRVGAHTQRQAPGIDTSASVLNSPNKNDLYLWRSLENPIEVRCPLKTWVITLDHLTLYPSIPSFGRSLEDPVEVRCPLEPRVISLDFSIYFDIPSLRRALIDPIKVLCPLESRVVPFNGFTIYCNLDPASLVLGGAWKIQLKFDAHWNPGSSRFTVSSRSLRSNLVSQLAHWSSCAGLALWPPLLSISTIHSRVWMFALSAYVSRQIVLSTTLDELHCQRNPQVHCAFRNLHRSPSVP